MITLELDETQAKILRDYLQRSLSDLSVEIAGTDRKDYREEIKQERVLLESVLAQLPASSR